MSSMHLFLYCPNGMMLSLYLPNIFGGRYKFDSSSINEELPYYVEARDNQWVLYCGDETEFCEADNTSGGWRPIGKAFPLENRAFRYLKYHGKIYTVYSELDSSGNNALIPYYFETNSIEYSIGRNTDNLIVYPQLYVSRHHASLLWDGNNWIIEDKNSTNGVYVNGRRVTQKSLCIGDVIYIMGLSIVVGNHYFSINNAGKRISINSPYIHRIASLDKTDIDFSKPSIQHNDDRAFDRPPRKLIKVDPKPIEIEMPPMKMSANRIPLLLRLGSPLVMGGQAIFTGNYISAITGMLLPSLTQGMTEKDRKDYETRRSVRYNAYLSEKAEEIEAERRYELSILNKAHPTVMEALSFSLSKDRLWERRKIDEDFLSIRIGTGELPLLAERIFEKKKLDLESDELVDKMYDLARKPVTLPKAPVILSFIEDYIVGVKGEKKQIADFVRNIILQLVSTHSYDELKICVLAGSEFANEFDFVKYLRHNWDDDMSVRFFGITQEDAQPMSNYFKTNEEKYVGGRGSSSKRGIPKNAPAFIIFALNKTLFESLEFLKNVLDDQEYHGISVLAAFGGLPKECTKIIEADSSIRLIDLKHPENPETDFALDKFDGALTNRCLTELYRTKLKSRLEHTALPSMLTFLEMFNVGRVEHLNPLARWQENNPIKSLAAQVGVGTDGSPFTLDLHEKRQGPHGLIAGMTGSGKSEFIITYILSMAVNFSPEEVAFILIDYKGGGLADAFEDKSRGIHLPHLVGTITNLDGAAIRRSLMSINSELKRRQAEFKKAKSATNEGTMDIYDYQRLYRAGRVSKPMPHLFIISDEFAELKKQQPEFMDELISTARIGRSLGVHLILATQKPGGVVNDQIWSNTKFRVCLKVQDRSDSMEMLKRPEAAELKQTGRFYLQVGYNEYFAMGQSAWCGAGYFPQDEAAKEEDTSVCFVDNAGRTVLNAKSKAEKKKAECKQIVAIVKHLSDIAEREKIEARRLWTEPLPAKLEYSTIPELHPATITATVGMVDDPEFQSQYPMTLELLSFHHLLLVGSSGSGKSTFLRTMLYSLVTTYSPDDVNYYIVDLSAGAMSSMSAMPHCGAYLTEENEAEFDRLLKLIKDIIAERKKLFTQAEVFSFDAYRKVAKLPVILVIIDSWMNISAFRKAQEYGLSIGDYMRDAANYGVKFILTINHINEISSRAKQEMDRRIMLQPKDKFDYNDVLNVRGTMLPPQLAGRGVCVIDGRPLEFHTAVPNCDSSDTEQNTKLKNLAAALKEKYSGAYSTAKLPMLSGVMDYNDFCNGIETDRIPLGLSLESMKTVSIPLQQLYTASIYFGNPIGIRPVLSNLIYAFYREDADLIIMRRRADTVFDLKAEEQLNKTFGKRFTLLDCSSDSISALDDMIIENITNTKAQHRNEYCEQNGIPSTDRGRTKKAARYIREHSKPLFVLFESLTDFLKLEMTDAQKAEFSALFEMIKGYNVYFFGCFYPDDESQTSKPLYRCFTKDDFALLFGGRFDSVWCTALPSEYRRMEKLNPGYDRFLMKYHNECHRMIMPCGELITAFGDPDEGDII